ncbi:DUF5126 domain-containing protein [Algibacter miyuki]|uniref:DUF5126 domain-containing protein n=1 Tax=Algibacter miyuki TaxID=1306933 RepID=A0ABV5GW23_9FLAO|nr:DUF5126 domain-containing protein [Algibacter miyuki]MDN3665161.1 DUF5126 domain-containing protein [Algibacter miyuki]
MKNIYQIVLIIGTLFLCSCNETDRIDFLDESSDVPMQVTDLVITPTPGGAILTYNIPEDPIISYAKAIYEIQPNVFREAKASRYLDTLKLVGYGNSDEHELKVITVGKNNVESVPLVATFQPLPPPVKTVFESLEIRSTFGGANVKFKNDTQANLTMVMLVDSTGTGEWEPATTFYTAAEEGDFSARGFPVKEMEFACYIKDRWNNKSDTLIKTLTPLYEEEILKDKWEWTPLPGDAQYNATYTPVYLYDNKVAKGNLLAAEDQPIPHAYTFDFGESIILSRMKLWHRPGYEYVEAPRYIEIWGTNDPSLDGSWDNWELLGAFESFKPSGLPLGTKSPEDITYASSLGEDFEFEVGLPAIRYFRLKTIEAWVPGSGKVQISEISFWGQVN